MNGAQGNKSAKYTSRSSAAAKDEFDEDEIKMPSSLATRGMAVPTIRGTVSKGSGGLPADLEDVGPMAGGEMPAKESSVRSLRVAGNVAGPTMAPVTGGAKVSEGTLSAADFAQPTPTTSVTSDDAPVLPFYYKLSMPNYAANNVSLKLVRQDLEKSFSASSVRSARGASPFVYSCDAWCLESTVRFRVSIFQADTQHQTGAGSQGPNHIVEFNQLSGCPWAFAKVMREINQVSKYCKQNLPPQAPPLPPPPLPTDLSSQGIAELEGLEPPTLSRAKSLLTDAVLDSIPSSEAVEAEMPAPLTALSRADSMSSVDGDLVDDLDSCGRPAALRAVTALSSSAPALFIGDSKIAPLAPILKSDTPDRRSLFDTHEDLLAQATIVANIADSTREDWSESCVLSSDANHSAIGWLTTTLKDKMFLQDALESDNQHVRREASRAAFNVAKNLPSLRPLIKSLDAFLEDDEGLCEDLPKQSYARKALACCN